MNCVAAVDVRSILRLVEQFKPIDEQDRQGLIALYERHLQETEDYLASIRVIAEADTSTAHGRIISHTRYR